MKILLISNLYEPYNRGGAEVVVKRMAQALIVAGHEVLLLTAGRSQGKDSLRLHEEQVDGLRIFRYYPCNLFFYTDDYHHSLPVRLIWHALDLFNHHSAVMTRRLLAREKPDLVMTHNLMGLGFTIPAVIRKAGITHAHILHDIQLAVRSGLMKQGQEQRFYNLGWLGGLYRHITSKQFGSPDLVISPSQFLLNFYRRLGFFKQSQLHMLRNPIDKRFYLEASAKKGNGLQLAYVGQLAEHKGLLTLKKAMGQITDASITMHVVGSGPLQPFVELWAKEDPRVHYHGRLPNEALPDFLSNMDATLLPTQTYENSPSIVFESLAAGVPIIVSDIGGAAEIIKDTQTGFKVQPGDVKGLTEAIKRLPQLQNEATKKACRESVAGLTAEQYVKRFMALVLRVQSGK